MILGNSTAFNDKQIIIERKIPKDMSFYTKTLVDLNFVM